VRRARSLSGESRRNRIKTRPHSPSRSPAAVLKLHLVLFAVVYNVYPNTPTPQLLHSVCLCVCVRARARSAVYHAGVVISSESVPAQRVPLCGGLVTRRTCSRARVAGSELRGDLMGRATSVSAAPHSFFLFFSSSSFFSFFSLPSCPWLRTCSAAEETGAPSPTLHYDKSRQAGGRAAVTISTS